MPCPAFQKTGRPIGQAPCRVQSIEDWSSRFPDELFEEFQEAFSLFANDSDGTIATATLGTVMRALGHNPTGAVLTELVRSTSLDEVDEDDHGGIIDFARFLWIMHSVMSNSRPDSEEDQILQAFQVFDIDGSGFVSADVVPHILVQLEPGLTESEIDEIVTSELGPLTDGDGRIEYAEFVRMMMAH
mmetsp:Transcript_50874/g.87496  ORF Transcript_50874/g.87496 Transcript_50874/m.87496 type:complete len:187 (+) Transcript_50874:139-699(+)